MRVIKRGPGKTHLFPGLPSHASWPLQHSPTIHTLFYLTKVLSKKIKAKQTDASNMMSPNKSSSQPHLTDICQSRGRSGEYTWLGSHAYFGALEKLLSFRVKVNLIRYILRTSETKLFYFLPLYCLHTFNFSHVIDVSSYSR